MSDSDQIDAVDDAGEHMEQADEDVTRGQRWYAKAYLTALFAVIIAGLTAAVYFGIVQPEFIITAEASIGWVLEYLVMGVVALFLLWTAAMILIALPGSFVSGIMSAVARIADAYELPTDDE